MYTFRIGRGHSPCGQSCRAHDFLISGQGFCPLTEVSKHEAIYIRTLAFKQLKVGKLKKNMYTLYIQYTLLQLIHQQLTVHSNLAKTVPKLMLFSSKIPFQNSRDFFGNNRILCGTLCRTLDPYKSGTPTPILASSPLSRLQ